MGRAPLRGDIPINLSAVMKDEARALRNKLLLYRLRNRNELRLDADAAIVGVAPRINQILTPLLSIVDEPGARDSVRDFATASHDGIVSERGLSMEAQLLDVVRELAGEGRAVAVPIRDITARFSERFGKEYARPITARWIGAIFRRRLHLVPYKSHGRYVLPVGDTTMLGTLYERYGISGPKQLDIVTSDADPAGGGHGDVGTAER